MLPSILITCSLCILTFSPYLLWASRWNIPTHLSVAFSVTAYIVPVLIVGVTARYGDDLVLQYSYIAFGGSLFFVLGMILSYQGRRWFFRALPLFSGEINDDQFIKVISRRVLLICLVSCAALVISFAIMGFVPAFAADPFSAKFFRGAYHDSYERVAFLYRSAHFALSTSLTLLLALWTDTKKIRFLFLAVITATLLSLSLTRSPAVLGILMWLGILAARRRKYFIIYLFSIIFIYGFGGAVFVLLSDIFYGQQSNLSVWDMIATGTPDVSDQLNFLQAFNDHGEFTLGRTIIGGLVPNQYKWNPSVWTLAIINNTDDVSDIASGGLRLPVPLWGYANFSWLGVCLISLFSGMATSRAMRYLRDNLASPLATRSAIILAIYSSFWLLLINYYRISMYTFFQIFVIYCIAGNWGGLSRRRFIRRLDIPKKPNNFAI